MNVDSAGGEVVRPEVLIWDDTVHVQNESSSLYFLRLSFGIEYDREEITRCLRLFYEEADISAYIVYETLGDFDVLLRLWVSRRFIIDEIENLLREKMRGTSLQEVEHIACRTRSHWGKRERYGLPPRGEDDPLIVGDRLIDAVNRFNESQFEKKTPVPRPVGTEELIEGGVLFPISLETKGIRFFVLFDRPKRGGEVARRDILMRLTEACERIEANWRNAHPDPPDPWPTGPQISVYSGTGTMSDFLLMARAPHGDFHEFASAVVFGLRVIGLGDVYQMRPYTYVIADRMFWDFREERVSVESAEITEATLQSPESDSLEFKATFAVNLRRLRHDGSRANDPLMRDNVVKAVCGFLNSPTGGTLIIGVLEVEHEYAIAEKRGQGAELLAMLKAEFKYVPPVDGDGRVLHPLPNGAIGVQHEYEEGGPYADADQYYGALRDALKDNIDPNPFPWLRLAEREIGGNRYAVISVRPAGKWCYATISTEKDPQFFVREAASTRAAKGREADLYRDADPRVLNGLRAPGAG